MVGYKLDGNVTDAITLRSTVLDLLHFRRGLQQRAMRIPPTPYDVELRRHWASFAATAGLELDPLRAVLHGVVRGVPIEVAQEAAPHLPDPGLPSRGAGRVPERRLQNAIDGGGPRREPRRAYP